MAVSSPPAASPGPGSSEPSTAARARARARTKRDKEAVTPTIVFARVSASDVRPQVRSPNGQQAPQRPSLGLGR